MGYQGKQYDIGRDCRGNMRGSMDVALDDNGMVLRFIAAKRSNGKLVLSVERSKKAVSGDCVSYEYQPFYDFSRVLAQKDRCTIGNVIQLMDYAMIQIDQLKIDCNDFYQQKEKEQCK